MNSFNIKKLKKENFEYVCFDYFDTIVHRTVNHKNMKRLWAKDLSLELLKYKECINSSFLYELRLQCEKKIHNYYIYENEPRYEWLINVMYSVICNEICITREEFYHLSLDSEIKSELKYQYIDKKNLEMAYMAKTLNLHVILVSDFYLPKEAFIAFLSVHKITCFEDIYISSELDVRKSNGTMFQFLNKNLFCNKKAFMIGDNENSDFTQPQKVGLGAKLITYSDNSKEIDKNKTKELLKKIINREKSPYANYSITLYLFIENLYKELKKHNETKVYFLAREGEYLKKLFELYQNFINDHTISTAYLCVSRFSLSNLQGDSENNFRRYLSDLDITPYTKKVVLVDIGWKGTMQNLLATKLPNVIFKGYYLGLTDKAICTECNYKIGIVFSHYIKKTIGYDCYLYNSFFQEELLAAGHGSTISYSGDGKPIFAPQEIVLETFSYLNKIRIDIEYDFQYVFEVLSKSCYELSDFREICIKTHLKEMMNQSKKYRQEKIRIKSKDEDYYMHNKNEHEIKNNFMTIKGQIKSLKIDAAEPISYLTFISTYAVKLRISWLLPIIKKMIYVYELLIIHNRFKN